MELNNMAQVTIYFSSALTYCFDDHHDGIVNTLGVATEMPGIPFLISDSLIVSIAEFSLVFIFVFDCLFYSCILQFVL